MQEGRTRGVFRGLALWLALGSLALGCSRGSEREGGELRILSLSPGVSRVLLALDRGDALVGVDAFSQELPELAHVPSLGGLFAPDLERAVELAPTLAIGVASAQQRSFFARLEERGVRVETVVAHTLDDVLESFLAIGSWVDRAARAEALVSGLREELAGIAAATGELPRVRVAMVVEREPLYVVGGGSFVSELIAVAGGENVFADQSAPYPQISLESLASRAPALLLDSTVPGTDPAAIAVASAWWRRFSWVERLAFVPVGEVTLPSPALARSARRLRALIHGADPPDGADS